MGRLTKQEKAEIVNKAVDLILDHETTQTVKARLFDFAFGLLQSNDVAFSEVYLSIQKAILTVQGVVEELLEDSNV